MQNIFKAIGRGLGIIVLILGLFLVSLGFKEIPTDIEIDPENYNAGAVSIQPSISGLLREFPSIIEPDHNRTTDSKVVLGRMLFFDPVLSEDNDMSCATCHHPDLGFSDGLPQAIGRGGKNIGPARTEGVTLQRSTPSLWNVAYTNFMFWDGRVATLEEQALVPLTHPDEMGITDATQMAAELSDIPEYLAMFKDAFGGDPEIISIENVANAIAAFERTLISNNSPFDQYANGDFNALTPAQRRGIRLFRSAATRCFECHENPTFASDTFRVIGAPNLAGVEADQGRHAVVIEGKPGAFKVPSLRNIILSAPYMHNGAIADLQAVIQFYAASSREDAVFQNLDPFIQGFDFSEQEIEDLVAFLIALTDESSMPEIPLTVPSGLAVVPRLKNPMRAVAATYNIASSADSATSPREPITLIASPGDNIQTIADQAQPGDTIMIEYGIYNQRVAIDRNDITLLGIPNEYGNLPILDGMNILTEAIISSGNNFEVGLLSVKNYTDVGVLVEGVTGVHMHDMVVANTGTYGLYPTKSTDVLVENSEVSGSDDAGIYAGVSKNVIIRNNVVHGNVLGIEIENTVNAESYGNNAYNNTNAILIVVLPQLPSKVSKGTKVYDNIIENNNHENFAKPGTAAALMPAGSGIGLVGADDVEIYGNTIKGNKTAGIGIFSLLVAYDANEIDVGPNPENVFIHDNTFENNGYDADKFITSMGIPGADILWDVSGDKIQVDEVEVTSFPPALPTSKWTAFAYRVY
ncbi:MAG: right-handed parallel beta-helix repeat-containing protein, partial [Chloroflexota bacterium]